MLADHEVVKLSLSNLYYQFTARPQKTAIYFYYYCSFVFLLRSKCFIILRRNCSTDYFTKKLCIVCSKCLKWVKSYEIYTHTYDRHGH